jgi:TolB-like protein
MSQRALSRDREQGRKDYVVPLPWNGLLIESIRAQLGKILTSQGFCHSDRMSRFLRLAVEKTIQGQGDQLKEYLIGTEVFDRNHCYDPRIDPIVRVEARRLRSKLKHYYEGEGYDDPLLIHLPKGSYVPIFERREPIIPSPEKEDSLRGEQKGDCIRSNRSGPVSIRPLEGGNVPFFQQSPWRAQVQPSLYSRATCNHIVWPVVLLVVGILAYVIIEEKSTAGSAVSSIVVLPLENLSRDPEQDYFADGIAEALTTELAKMGALRVISRYSAMKYNGSRKSLQQIARELKVDAVVQGSVQRSGQRVRITVELIHATTDRILWAESYERELREILGLQSEVAKAIAHVIRVRLTPQGAVSDKQGVTECSINFLTFVLS